MKILEWGLKMVCINIAIFFATSNDLINSNRLEKLRRRLVPVSLSWKQPNSFVAPPYLKAAGKDAMEIYRTFATF